MDTRRKRIPEGRSALFWDEMAILPITVEPALTPAQAKSTLILCDQYRLTIYDAAYLGLAKRNPLPLATLDDALIRAATSEAVSLIG